MAPKKITKTAKKTTKKPVAKRNGVSKKNGVKAKSGGKGCTKKKTSKEMILTEVLNLRYRATLAEWQNAKAELERQQFAIQLEGQKAVYAPLARMQEAGKVLAVEFKRKGLALRGINEEIATHIGISAEAFLGEEYSIDTDTGTIYQITKPKPAVRSLAK